MFLFQILSSEHKFTLKNAMIINIKYNIILIRYICVDIFETEHNTNVYITKPFSTFSFLFTFNFDSIFYFAFNIYRNYLRYQYTLKFLKCTQLKLCIY